MMNIVIKKNNGTTITTQIDEVLDEAGVRKLMELGNFRYRINKPKTVATSTPEPTEHPNPKPVA